MKKLAKQPMTSCLMHVLMMGWGGEVGWVGVVQGTVAHHGAQTERLAVARDQSALGTVHLSIAAQPAVDINTL